MERPFEFTSDGATLRGILHIPEGLRRETGVVLLNSGLVYRAGPHRLYVKTARKLCQEGFVCLRFDFPGVGDSDDGELTKLNVDLFSETSHTVNAVGAFMGETGVQDVTLLGLCTSSRNAVRAARNDARVKSLILLSMPITFDRSRRPLAGLIAHQQLIGGTRIPRVYQYLKSTWLCNVSLAAWQRSLRLKAAFSGWGKEILAVTVGRGHTGIGNRGAESLATACRRLSAAGCRIFFIYGERDETLVRDFRLNISNQKEVRTGDANGTPLQTSWVVAGSNHVFSGIQTQEALIGRIVDWLDADGPFMGSERAELRGTSEPAPEDRVRESTGVLE